MVRSPLIVTAAAGLITVAAVTPSGVATASPPPAAAVAPGPGTTQLTSAWRIQSSAVAGSSGADISRPDYSATGWLPISRPETLMAGLVENGRYPDVFYSDRLKAVPTDQFNVNWWYRDQLTVHPRPGGRTHLIMNGVLGTADLWVNGTKIASRSQLQARTPGSSTTSRRTSMTAPTPSRSTSPRTIRRPTSATASSTGTRTRRTRAPG